MKQLREKILLDIIQFPKAMHLLMDNDSFDLSSFGLIFFIRVITEEKEGISQKKRSKT